jgi:hypothetical protein
MQVTGRFKTEHLLPLWPEDPKKAPHKKKISDVVIAELHEQLTLPTSHNGSKCYSRFLIEEYEDAVLRAIAAATSLDDLCERLQKEVRI